MPFLVAEKPAGDLKTVEENISRDGLPRVFFEFSAEIGLVIVEFFTNLFGGEGRSEVVLGHLEARLLIL